MSNFAVVESVPTPFTKGELYYNEVTTLTKGKQAWAKLTKTCWFTLLVHLKRKTFDEKKFERFIRKSVDGDTYVYVRYLG